MKMDIAIVTAIATLLRLERIKPVLCSVFSCVICDFTLSAVQLYIAFQSVAAMDHNPPRLVLVPDASPAGSRALAYAEYALAYAYAYT